MFYSPKQITQIPESAGVYRFYDVQKKLLYIGKAKSLKKRVASYFGKTHDDRKTIRLVGQIASIEINEVQSEFEALLFEAKLINLYKPKYNFAGKDDKQYVYIVVTKEEFPKIIVSRRKNEKPGYVFGPFPSARIVREMLDWIRHIFPFCAQKQLSRRPCFYSHLGLCDPCPSFIKSLKETEAIKQFKKQYTENLRKIRYLLEGRVRFVEKDLEKAMKQFAREENFEMAAVSRDRLAKLKFLLQHFEPAQRYLEDPELLIKFRREEAKELKMILQQYFGRNKKVTKIECYDISNISGRLGSGSLVVFQNGQPQKNLYRKFQIRTIETPNDFAMLSEVLRRRLKHKEWKLPDLFVIDGGRPQLAALAKVLLENGLKIPMIGLAKQEEEIVIPVGKDFLKLKLPRQTPVLRLLQRLRDEAHRFAHKYHEHLRLKNLLKLI